MPLTIQAPLICFIVGIIGSIAAFFGAPFTYWSVWLPFMVTASFAVFCAVTISIVSAAMVQTADSLANIIIAKLAEMEDDDDDVPPTGGAPV